MSWLLPHCALAQIRQGAVRFRSQRAVATASHGYQPHPGNTAERLREELEKIAHDRVKRSKKGKGLGGLHSMDPEKQRYVPKGGQAKIKAIQEYKDASRELGRDGSAHACHTWKSHEPPIVPPGYGEWKT